MGLARGGRFVASNAQLVRVMHHLARILGILIGLRYVICGESFCGYPSHNQLSLMRWTDLYIFLSVVVTIILLAKLYGILSQTNTSRNHPWYLFLHHFEIRLTLCT